MESLQENVKLPPRMIPLDVTLVESTVFLFMAPQPPVGRGLLTVEASRLHTNTPQSEGLL